MAKRLTSIKEIDFTPQSPVMPSPIDWRDIFMYQVMIDRFDDGKDYPPYDPKTAKRGRDEKDSFKFQGGTLNGITRRLDYIKGLGCNGVWIGPPFKQNADDDGSYHGYGIQDFLQIDPRFGTTEDLQHLVKEAHKRGMYVVLDIVINHTADVFQYAEKDAAYREEGQYTFKDWHRGKGGTGELGPDDAIWPVEMQDPDCFKRRGSIRDFGKADIKELVDADFFSLKDLDTTNPKVLDVLINAYKYWIAVADVDGYRIDTVRHVEPEACAVFCNAVREFAVKIGKHNFIMFGEIIAGDDELRKYIGGNNPSGNPNEWYPELDAVLDYPLYNSLDEVIKGQKTSGELRDRLHGFRNFYRNFGEVGKYFVTFVDNHDQPSRPYRRFLNDVSDWQVGMLGIGYLLCNIGIPCVYYGTEQGFDGGGASDTFVRETMFGGKWGAFDTTGCQFFNTEHPIYKNIARIAKARTELAPLRYGRQYFREISGNGEHFGHPVDGKATLAFSRVLDSDEILCCFNLDPSDRNDWVLVGKNQFPVGTKLIDVICGGDTIEVKEAPNGGAMVQVPMAPRAVKVFKRAD